MDIRRARDADAGALARIFHDAVRIGAAGVYSEAQLAAWSPCCPTAETWRRRLDGLDTLVAETDAPIGFLSMDGGLVDLLFVTPAHLGRGVAHRLYRAALDHAGAAGLTRLTVDASEMSRRFFARQGWSAIGAMAHEQGAARVVTTLMALDLTPGAPPPG